MDAVITLSGAERLSETGHLGAASDADLVRRCQANDLMAFDELFARYRDRVYSYVRRMVSEDGEAEDVVQEVFVRAFQGLAGYDGRAGFATWLFRIATNLCVDRSRLRARRPRAVPLSSLSAEGQTSVEIPDHRNDPAGAVIHSEMAEVLERAVGDLSEKLRPVLLLHDTQGLSYEEIAQVLRVPLGTVKSRLFLAREQLRQALRDYLKGTDSR